MCESALFVQAIPSIEELATMQESAFHQWFEAQECNHLKALLYLFNVCHHIIIMQPRPLFDVDLLRTFRLLQITRNKTAAATMAAIVNSLGLNDRAKKKLPWTNLPGQFTPTVSLFFPSPTFAKSTSTDIEQSTSAKYKRFRVNLEAQVALLLPKLNICVKTRRRPRLSREPSRERRDGANDSEAERGDDSDRDSDKDSDKDSEGPDEKSWEREKDRGESRESQSLFTLHPNKAIFLMTNKFKHPQSMLFQSIIQPNQLDTYVDSLNTDIKRLRSMISRNIDTVRRHLTQGKRSLPTSADWYTVAQGLQETIFKPATTADQNEKFSTNFDCDFKFAAQRCIRATQPARRLYLRDLPNIYSSQEHNHRLQQAIQFYRLHASPPAIDHYENLLIQDLQATWTDGRQLCEAVSLSGKNCTLKVHTVPTPDQHRQANSRQQQKDVVNQAQAHVSGYRTINSCGCGETRSPRVDPFEFAEANTTFFQNARCCTRLPTLASAASPDAGWGCFKVGTAASYNIAKGMGQDGFSQGSNQLSAWRPLLSPDDGKKKDTPAEAPVYVGFEYECGAGHRFFKPIESQDNNLTSYPPQDLPLLSGCNACDDKEDEQERGKGKANNNNRERERERDKQQQQRNKRKESVLRAQIMRLHVVVPADAGYVLKLTPLLVPDDKAALGMPPSAEANLVPNFAPNKSCTAHSVSVGPDMLACMYLPLFYYFQPAPSSKLSAPPPNTNTNNARQKVILQATQLQHCCLPKGLISVDYHHNAS